MGKNIIIVYGFLPIILFLQLYYLTENDCTQRQFSYSNTHLDDNSKEMMIHGDVSIVWVGSLNYCFRLC